MGREYALRSLVVHHIAAANSITGRHGASRRPACPSVNCFGGAFAVELPATQNRQLRESCASQALPVETDRRLPSINLCEVFRAYGDEVGFTPGFFIRSSSALL